MNIFEKFKSFLGLPNRNSEQHDGPRDPIRRNCRETLIRDEPVEEHEGMGFNVFSNPLDMQRFFEHQMHEMMKSFGGFSNGESFFGNGHSFFGGGADPFATPHQEEHRPTDGHLRDHFLKPGYEQVTPFEEPKPDSDLDGRFNIGDLDSVLKDRHSQTTPRKNIPLFHFYGQSVSTKTIRNADGSIETEKTIRDQDGNQETTMTRRQGDKEYSVTTKTDKEGRQEIIENMINMDANDKGTLLIDPRVPHQPTHSTNKPPPSWFPFDKYFN